MSLKSGRAHLGIALLCTLLVALPALAAKPGKAAGKSKKAQAASAPVRKAPEVRLNPNTDPGAATQSTQTPSTGAPPSRGPTRIDFDDRLIQGQTNKSGAVYLYDRKELKQRSMVKDRESFREEIIRTVYDR